MPSLQMNSHSFLRHLFTCTSNGIAVITPNGSWIEINPALSRMLGYSNEELMMLSLRDIVHPEEQWDDLLEDEYESLETVRRLIHKNGSVIWAGIHILKFEEEGGENRSRILLQITDKTEIRELERQLIRHENLFELVTQNSRDIIYQCSLDGVLLYCSRSFQELLDYSPDELIGKMEEMLYHPDDLQAFNESRQSLTKTNQFRIRHKAGIYLWFEIKVKQVTDKDGTGILMIIGRDITERKKQEDLLAEAERIALIGSWEWNILHNQVTFSQQLYRIMETCPQQGGLASILDLVPAHEQSGFKEKIEWALKGNNLSFEFRNTDKSGVNKYFHIRGIVIFSENGVPAKITGTVQDVTEQKLVELKLQETVERYTSLKKYNHDAVVSLDLDGNIINGNMMFQELTGYPIHEILGQSFSTFSGRRDIKEILGKSLKDVSAEKLIDKIIHKSGKQSEVLTTIAPIIINNENVGYYILAKDITEQKKLIIAKEAAESTNKAKSEFLAMMSHEIRTPMNGVIGMTDLLMETTVLDEQQKEYLEIIRKSGDTLLSIINDILDFSKIDSGKTDLLEEAFDVRDCIFEAVDVLSPKAREKKLDISFSLSPDVPAVLVGDSMRLKQILMNLIGNAIKFTKDGGIQVSVKKQAGNDQKVKLRFGVKDTGIGIDMNKHDQLFQPFYQVDNFMTRRSEGTGLGLAICKKLVNLMGGEIWVETTDEPGATFIFTVMLKEEKSNKVLLMDINDSEGTKTKRQLKVMIAEDNKINQVVLIKMLENQGHSIRIAENGHEVIKLIQEEAFDVIFMDVHMPMMNGLEATAAIKDMLKADECPVIIAVTANALKGDREKCLAAGMDEYISKPINNKAVFEIIQKFFG